MKGCQFLCLIIASSFICGPSSRVSAQQSCQNVSIWEGVPVDQYERTFVGTNQTARPLGFKRSTIPYVSENKPNPCVKITGTNDRRVEIMAESYPTGSNICVKPLTGQTSCNTAGIYNCEQAAGGEVTYVFFCEGTGCDQSDTVFYYRLTVSVDSADMDPELWCGNRNTDEYPKSLQRSLPPGLTLPPKPKTTPSSGTTIGLVTPCDISTLLLEPKPTPSSGTTIGLVTPVIVAMLLTVMSTIKLY